MWNSICRYLCTVHSIFFSTSFAFVLFQLSEQLLCVRAMSFSFFFFSISFNAASKARRPYQFSGKITVKAKEKSYSKLEIPYQAEVLEGWVILWLYVESGSFLYNIEDRYSYQSLFLLFFKVWVWNLFCHLLLAATWALTTQLRCSTSETALLIQWTDPSSSQIPSALPSGYTMCPCPKKPKPCLRLSAGTRH